jgi:hypothetical protein
MTGINLGPVSAPIALRNKETHEHLLDLRANVHSDGDATSFAVAFTNQKPFKVKVSFEEMAPILNELRYASNLMMSRQRRKLDGGAQKMMDLVEHALRPTHIEIIVNPVTGDRVFILLFDDHAPMAIAISPADLQVCCADLADATSKATN